MWLWTYSPPVHLNHFMNIMILSDLPMSFFSQFCGIWLTTVLHSLHSLLYDFLHLRHILTKLFLPPPGLLVTLKNPTHFSILSFPCLVLYFLWLLFWKWELQTVPKKKKCIKVLNRLKIMVSLSYFVGWHPIVLQDTEYFIGLSG